MWLFIKGLWTKVSLSVTTWISIALGAIALFFRWSAQRAKQQAKAAEEVAHGYEAADAMRTRAQVSAEKIAKKYDEMPKPDPAKRDDMEHLSEWSKRR